MKIEFVNHASVILEVGDVRVMTDPWFSGRVFDESWALLSRTRFTYQDFASITHLWISHAHPDHFNVHTLRNIPPAYARKITPLYQAAEPEPMRSFFSAHGFARAIELQPGQWAPLSGSLQVLCMPSQSWGDSWACFRSKDVTVLNTNDCLVDTDDEAARIKGLVPRIDVLLSHFCYAMWAGNRTDTGSKQTAARKVLQELKLQIDVFAPKWTIPFASFNWYCHEDNHHCNEQNNRIADVQRVIDKETTSNSIILYPGETWRPGREHDNLSSVRAYQADYQRLSNNPPLTRRRSVDRDELARKMNLFLGDLRRSNKSILLYMIKPARIYLRDYHRSYKLSIGRGFREVLAQCKDCDIELSSDALMHCCDNVWGIDTLWVNARFELIKRDGFRRFARYFAIRKMNRRDRTYPGITKLARKKFSTVLQRIAARHAPLVARFRGNIQR